MTPDMNKKIKAGEHCGGSVDGQLCRLDNQNKEEEKKKTNTSEFYVIAYCAKQIK